MDGRARLNRSQGRSPPARDSEEEAQNEPLEFELGLGPEDEAAAREEADRTYRGWMKMIGKESTQ